MISDTGFREPLWQHLHTASLKLARQAIRMAQRQHTSREGAVAEFPAASKPDSNDCIDMMADSKGAYSRGAEELGKVGLSICCDASDMWGCLERQHAERGLPDRLFYTEGGYNACTWLSGLRRQAKAAEWALLC